MPILSVNKRAIFDYEIFEKFEAGIELKGFEAKAITTGRANISGAYAVIRDNEVWLLNLDIPPYQPKNTPESYDSKRTRRLLLKRNEIKNLIGNTKEKGLTLVVTKLYTKNNKAKVELGLARSRKKHDKRELIRKREVEREIQKFKK
ncbi:MAG: SsrA-binding protein SmpB [Patescibacteria group bacterium]|nr:SsrA-binding protein SmpB [Patescibacteria group bacterium]